MLNRLSRLFAKEQVKACEPVTTEVIKPKESLNPTSEKLLMTDATTDYASLSDADKIVALEKAVKQQGDYLKAYRDSIKTLNRRNTLAIIELQKLIRDAELKYPALAESIHPVMAKVDRLLDFKQPYEEDGIVS